MIVHLINLDRDTQRLERFLRLNDFLPNVVRALALEGRSLDRQKLARDGYIAADLAYNDSALGNAHSHISLWRQAVETRTPGTIAEDDAIFSRDYLAASEAVLRHLPDDWDLILWGWNFDAFLWVEMPEGVSKCRMEFDQSDLRENIDRFRNTKSSHIPIRLRHGFGLMAYTVSCSGARALMKICLPLRNSLVEFSGFDVVIANQTIDAMMNRAYPRMKAYVCVPPLAVSENRHETSHTILDR